MASARMPLTYSGAPESPSDHTATLGSRSAMRTAGPIAPSVTLVTYASQVTPYNGGVASRWPRLAEKTRAPVSAATPTTALATVLRTGSAVRPAPRCRASRTPISAVAGLTLAVARVASSGRPVRLAGAGAARTQPALAARQVGQTARAPVISTHAR